VGRLDGAPGALGAAGCHDASIGSRLASEVSSAARCRVDWQQHRRTNASTAVPKIVDRDSGPMWAARRLQQSRVSLARDSGHLTGVGITALELVLTGGLGRLT
jgi:hypothetical protein